MKSIAAYLLSAVPAAFAGQLNRTHYGDPNTIFGCLSDEVKAKINGLDGDLCIPPCDSSGKCPQDKPAGVTATPSCVLTSSTGDKYCALTCSSGDLLSPKSLVLDAQCGAKASCKKAQSGGLCTYDDVPKPPSSPHWAPVDSPTFQEQSVCLAVGFTTDGQTGFAGAGSNGVGAQIIKSVDGGKTWAPTPGQNASFNIYLDASAASAKSAVVSGAIAQSHTTDGEHFVSGGPILCPSQDIGVIPESNDFALVAQCSKGQGVYRSSDGAKYEAFVIPETLLNNTIEMVRYGAFPSANTWYVTAGTWPDTDSARKSLNKKRGRKRATHRLTVGADHFDFNSDYDSPAVRDGPVHCSEDPSNCFAAAIVKTTDAGKTWTKVYENINTGDNIYPNGIHCSTEDHCVAVVEGDTSRILVTRDGGKSWKETRHDDDPHSSLVAVRMLDDKEGWVSGGEMSNAFEGRFWHTLDGGDTWTKEAIPGLYTFSFDMVSRESGYAVALTRSSGVQLLKYRTNQTSVGDARLPVEMTFAI